MKPLFARRNCRFRPLRVEQFEHRLLLSANSGSEFSPSWFESSPPRAFETIAAVESGEAFEADLIGPRNAHYSRWVVRLTGSAGVDRASEVGQAISSESVDFRLVRGLGLPGLALVETDAQTLKNTERYLEGIQTLHGSRRSASLWQRNA